MSEADNRDASNLLLLCLLHAWEIDAIPEQYPTEVLRAWNKSAVYAQTVGYFASRLAGSSSAASQ